MIANGAAARVFELGEVFERNEAGIAEKTSLAFGFAADRNDEPPWRDSAFLRLKGDCEALLREVTGRRATTVAGTRPDFHSGKTGLISIDGAQAGIIGCVDPRVAHAHGLKANAYVALLDLQALPPYRVPRYRPPSRFPSTYRDLALIVDRTVTASEIEDAVAESLGSLCTGVTVFDEYRGPQVGDGLKSIAVRAILQRFDGTITDEEADAAIARVLDAVRERFGATIRT
jgi:phenylalanyl-tRNA synthetase beta chain